MEKRQRRARGTAKDKVAVHLAIDRAEYAKIGAVADGLGISKSRALEMMLTSVAVDANGRPDFFEGPLPTDSNEELPLSNTA